MIWSRAWAQTFAIDYKTTDFAKVLRDYDVVLNSLGTETLNKSLEVLKPGGKLISISGPPDPDFAKDQGASWFLKFVMSLLSSGIRKKAKRHRVSYSFLFMRASGEQLSEITSLIDAGVIRPVVNRVFPFESTGEALAYVETGRAKGKVVVKVDKSGVASGNRLPRLFPGVVALSRSERTRSRTGISARGYLFP